MDEDEEYIKKCLEWIARRKALLDQAEKEFEDQYPMKVPFVNRMRLEAIEAQKLRIEINEYELGGFIKDYLEKNK